MADNCDLILEQLRQAQKERDELQAALTEQQRLRAAEAKANAGPGPELMVTLKDGTKRTISDKEISAMFDQLGQRMNNAEMDAVIKRGFGEEARPVGADGRFQNYARIVKEVDVQTAEDYARLAEALTGSWRDLAPDDFALITKVQSRDDLLDMAAKAYSEFVTRDQVAAAMARDAAGFMTSTERLTRLRVLADSSKREYLDTLRQILDAKQTSSAPISAELKRQAFDSYKLALASERHFSIAKRKIGQSLQSLQSNIGDPIHFRYQADEMAITPADITNDEAFARVMEAVSDRGKRGTEQLRLHIEAVEASSANPSVKLDKGWFNQQMILGNALVKDSQLTNIRTQAVANLGGNFAMHLYGPVRQAFENGALLTPYGTKFSIEQLGEGWKIAWESAGIALDSTRASVRQIVSDSFFQGKLRYGGNTDLATANVLPTNVQDLQRALQLMDQPWEKGGLLNPKNIAIHRNKLQSSLRLMLWSKLPGFDKLPITPGLRALGTVDEISAHFGYTFKLNNDLRVRARQEIVKPESGLTLEETRQRWVDARLQEAFYQAPVTPEDVRLARKRYGIGSEVTDQEVAARLTNEHVGMPRLESETAQEAYDYTLFTRMQSKPGEEGGFTRAIDDAMMKARQHWAVDSLVPYWRAPFNAFLFDMNLAGVEVVTSTAKVLFSGNPTAKDIAKMKAAWATTGTLFTLFAGLDAMGVVTGSGPRDPVERKKWLVKNKPNSLKFGDLTIPYLGGLPILNTMFLWKDTLEAIKSGQLSVYDQKNAFYSIMQIGTSQVLRQTGFGQLTRLFDMLDDPEQKAGRFFGYLASGQMIPFVGVERDIERLTGFTSNDMYQTKAPTAEENYIFGGDAPKVAMDVIRSIVSSTTPIGMALLGGQRIEKDWLGTDLKLPFGLDTAAAIPFFPQNWPQGRKGNVYAELESLNLLNPPSPLMTRKLENISMSDALQKEYAETFSSVKSEMPPTARMSFGGQRVAVTFNFPVGVDMPQRDGSVVFLKESNSEAIDIGYMLDKHTKGKTFLEAAQSLMNDPIYQAMQDNPATSGDLAVRDQPSGARRKQAATVLMKGLKDYYGLLTLDRLNGSSSQAAQEWKQRRIDMLEATFQQSTGGIRDLGEALQPPQ